MLETLLVAVTLAAAPSVAYKPDPRASADVGSVALQPVRSPCFEVVRGSLLASSRKTDRAAVYVLSVMLAEGGPFQMQQVVRADGQPLRQVSMRHGDVACTEYQCPTGSAGVFELSEADRAAIADGQAVFTAKTSLGARCDVPITARKAELEALDSWMARLPAPKG